MINIVLCLASYVFLFIVCLILIHDRNLYKKIADIETREKNILRNHNRKLINYILEIEDRLKRPWLYDNESEFE